MGKIKNHNAFSNYFINDKILIFIKMFCTLLIFLGRTMQLTIIISINFGDLLQSLVCFHRSTCKIHYCPPLLIKSDIHYLIIFKIFLHYSILFVKEFYRIS